MSTSTDDYGAQPVDAGAPTGAISRIGDEALVAIRDRLEGELVAGQTVRGGGVPDYRDALFTAAFSDRPVWTLAWPDSLYIPSQADYRTYWFSPPPADHRYRYAYADSPGGSTADAGTGRVFTWVNVSDLAHGHTGYAGVGARIVPSATLSYLTVGADVDLVAESRWWYLPGSSAGFASFSYSATAYLAVWAIDPVTGRWDLVRPFASRSLFSFNQGGQGGSAVSSRRVAFDDLTATVQVQAGRQYAVTVSFEATINLDCRDRSDREPYRRQPGDDIRLWASVAGQVASISASTKVLIP